MIRIAAFTGKEAEPYLPELSRLRVEVFREYPYLYDGSLELGYEAEYLQSFLKAPDFILVIAFDGDQIVGVSSALPLFHESEEIKAPWLTGGDDLSKVFYLSESVLKKEYRGQGIGVRFFEERERWARQKGYKLVTFCAVVRPANHPLKPRGYQPLDAFWRRRGYQKKAGYTCTMNWKQINESEESKNILQFWSKNISS
jgi:GNAT superfamily N-acetyltransferase